MSAPVLELKNLSIGLPKGSDRDNAVIDVSLSVAPGEIVCLVGESGSGKSVIAFSTMGLLPKSLPRARRAAASRCRARTWSTSPRTGCASCAARAWA